MIIFQDIDSTRNPTLSLKYTNDYISGYRFYEDPTLSPKQREYFICSEEKNLTFFQLSKFLIIFKPC